MLGTSSCQPNLCLKNHVPCAAHNSPLFHKVCPNDFAGSSLNKNKTFHLRTQIRNSNVELKIRSIKMCSLMIFHLTVRRFFSSVWGFFLERKEEEKASREGGRRFLVLL